MNVNMIITSFPAYYYYLAGKQPCTAQACIQLGLLVCCYQLSGFITGNHWIRPPTGVHEPGDPGRWLSASHGQTWPGAGGGPRGPPCRQTQIVFLWQEVNQWGEGIGGPACPGGRRPAAVAWPTEAGRREAAVKSRTRPSPVPGLPPSPCLVKPFAASGASGHPGAWAVTPLGGSTGE